MKRNDPLTIDDLRKMKEHFVWVQNPGEFRYGRWEVVTGVSEDGKDIYTNLGYTLHNYGTTWIAYEYKPIR